MRSLSARNEKESYLGGSSGLVVMEQAHVPKVVGSNRWAVYWMDIAFFPLIYCKNCIVCLKRLKINKKRLGLAHF